MIGTHKNPFLFILHQFGFLNKKAKDTKHFQRWNKKAPGS
jgi:hypothetical protein